MADSCVPRTVEAEGVPATPAPETREPERYLAPPVDIHETPEELVVTADLPGADRENIEVGVDNGILTLRATVARRPVGSPLHVEFALLDYYRQFQLGERVDAARISAEYKNGVLAIHLPKVEEAKPRRIAIATA